MKRYFFDTLTGVLKISTPVFWSDRGKKLQLHIQLGDDRCAAGAQTFRMVGLRVHPAAGTLGALGFADADGQLGKVHTAGNLGTFLCLRPIAS